MKRERRGVLLLGSTGQVGRELLPLLRRRWPVLAPPRAELDLENFAAVRDAIGAAGPAIIVNAAGFTEVDRAETDPASAFALNEHLVRVLAEEAARIGAMLVHYSTDYVFDGLSRTPYLETDTPRPINVYGASKLAGERAIADVGPRHLIFRTSWVFGPAGKNFLSTLLRLATERPELRVVDDQTSRPTWSRRLAEATDAVVSRLVATDVGEAVELPWGLYHLAGGGEATRYDFARAVVAAMGAPERPVHRVSSAEFPTPARRPQFSVLDTSRVASVFGVTLPDWREDIGRVVTESTDGRRSSDGPSA